MTKKTMDTKYHDTLTLACFLIIIIGNSLTECKDYTMCRNFVETAESSADGLIYIHPNNRMVIRETCILKISSCSYCKFQFDLIKDNLDQTCHHRPTMPCSSDRSMCKRTNPDPACLYDCSYIKLEDPYYKDTATIILPRIEDSGQVFTTISRSVKITVCRRSATSTAFKLKYKVIEKMEFIKPGCCGNLPLQVPVQSPNFPLKYVLNRDIFMYNITRLKRHFYTQVIFTDWFLSEGSFITFKYQIDGKTKYQRYNSYSYRPVLTTSGTIQMNFSTGYNYYYSNKKYGFKAEVIFTNKYTIPVIPVTRCGGSFEEESGGSLSLHSQYKKYYDCVWIIKRHPQFTTVNLYLDNFVSYSGASVVIHEGITSNGKKLTSISTYQLFRRRSETGFYLRLKGFFGSKDKFQMGYAYATFSNGACAYNFFKCDTGYCINSNLKCDGKFHCLDESDEAACGKAVTRDPRLDSGPAQTWNVTLIIPLIVTIFVVIALCMFFIFVCKLRKFRQTTSPRRGTRISSISGNVSRQHNHNHIRMNLTFEGEIDAPPTYEEVMTPVNSPQGNFNLAFNWSQNDVNEPISPPSYQEYMGQTPSDEAILSSVDAAAAVDNFNNYDDDNPSDDSTVVIESVSSSGNDQTTDMTSDDQISLSGLSLDNVAAMTQAAMSSLQCRDRSNKFHPSEDLAATKHQSIASLENNGNNEESSREIYQQRRPSTDYISNHPTSSNVASNSNYYIPQFYGSPRNRQGSNTGAESNSLRRFSADDIGNIPAEIQYESNINQRENNNQCLSLATNQNLTDNHTRQRSHSLSSIVFLADKLSGLDCEVFV